MGDIQNKDFSLLTQKEIDALVGFLRKEKDSVGSSVLSQASIDKLLELLRFNEVRRKRKVMTSDSSSVVGTLSQLIVIRKKDEICEMTVSIDKEQDRVRVFVINRNDGNRMEITPELLNEGDGDNWGYCMPPIILCRLARALNVKYTTETYEAVCARYAERMFGDAHYRLPFSYLPDNAETIENLL